MPEPAELILRLPSGGAWPRSLIELALPEAISPDLAATEVAGASRRFRQGVRAMVRGFAMVGYPHETADLIARRWARGIMAMQAEFPETLPKDGPGVRWTARRKLAVVISVATEALTISEVTRRWAVSEEEFRSWAVRFARFGLAGLMSTKTQSKRPGAE